MARAEPKSRHEREHATGGYLPIEDHGIIGNLHTVALVGNEGTIDWFCAERFDSPSLFGSILDAESGGCFSLQPIGERFTTKQLYLPGTAVLVTRFFTESGVGEIIDFMPLEDSSCSIVRRIEVVRGSCASGWGADPRSTTRAHRTGWRSMAQLATFLAADKMCELRSATVALEADGGPPSPS